MKQVEKGESVTDAVDPVAETSEPAKEVDLFDAHQEQVVEAPAEIFQEAAPIEEI